MGNNGAIRRNKPELLAPAGNLEKLKTAIRFGADAVYLAGNRFGLRAGADNFTLEEMTEGIGHCHTHGCKAYLAINILAHNADVDGMPDWLSDALATGPDGVIVADPGIMGLVRALRPDMPIHLSTQANVTNLASARFWHAAGVGRIVLARELSLREMTDMRAGAPEGLEFEAFVHGAMCMAYSGRCMLSQFLTGRDANRGDCAQPCRWSYGVMEEKRPGEWFPVEEDERGTYLFNSRDLCLLRRIPELMDAGLASFKIEGRMKSPFYAATVVKAYREAIDAAWEGRWEESDLLRWEKEVSSVSNRGFTEGFLDGVPDISSQRMDRGGYERAADFVAIVQETSTKETLEPTLEPTRERSLEPTLEICASMSHHAESELPDTETGHPAILEQRNRFRLGDPLECLPPRGPSYPVHILSMKNAEGTSIEVAPHPQMTVLANLSVPVPPGSLLRRPLA